MGYMGVSKNSGKTPKMDDLEWKTLLKLDDFGGKTHHFRKHPYWKLKLRMQVANPTPPPKLAKTEVV